VRGDLSDLRADLGHYSRLQFLYLDYWSGDDTVSLSVPIGEVDPRSRGECGSGWWKTGGL